MRTDLFRRAAAVLLTVAAGSGLPPRAGRAPAATGYRQAGRAAAGQATAAQATPASAQ